MTASARGLAILFAFGIVVLIAFALGERTRPPSTGPLIAAARLDHVTMLYWSAPAIGLVRGAHGWTAGSAVPVASRAVEDVLDGLRSARAHRLAAAAAAGTLHRQLTIFSGSETIDIAIGEPLAGTDQQWIVVDGTAALVDGWLARALDPAPIAFRDREPFADVANAQRVRLQWAGKDVALAGTPWRHAGRVISADARDRVLTAIGNLKLVATASGATGGASLEVDGRVATIGGACSRGIAIEIAGAYACVDATAWRAVEDAFAAFADPATTTERSPAGFPLDRIAIAGGVVTFGKTATVTIANVEHPADPQRIDELVRALSTPGELAHAITPTASMTITPLHGEPIGLGIGPTHVQRRSEPLAIAVTPEQHAILLRTAA
ncbi:MAG TPA: hypothetical protein VGC41_17040, partial [Kofleriaceae bacterium]